jgi:hypothetical protein
MPSIWNSGVDWACSLILSYQADMSPLKTRIRPAVKRWLASPVFALSSGWTTLAANSFPCVRRARR